MKKFTSIILLFLITNSVFSQEAIPYPTSFQALYATVFEGDTLGILSIPETSVIRYKFNTGKERNLYNRALRRVNKVYPYYEIALKVLKDLEDVESNSKKRVYRKFKRNTRKNLMSKFEKELRQLTMSEGKILVKMINRNSGSNFNELIKNYLSPLKVWAYNLIAKKYGYDLKAPYIIETEENKYLEMALKAKGIKKTK